MKTTMIHRRTQTAGVSALAAVALLIAPATCGALPFAAQACGAKSATAPALPAAAQLPPGSQPLLPSVFLDTAQAPTTGRKIKVESDDYGGVPGSLQAALDEAVPGDAVELRAGGLYAGNFVLPAKAGPGWITIRAWSTPSGFPAEGRRISPSLASQLPKIVTENALPAVSTAPGAHHYRFVGIQFAVADGVATNGGVVVFGDGNQTEIEQVPTDLVVDRCIVRGNATGDVTRGITLNSARTAVVDSRVTEIHARTIDTQAICGWAGPGPFKVVNNYLEGAAENIMFGGGDPRIENLVPSDIEVRRNHLFKPLSWRAGDPSYGGTPWVVKNLFELKNARRVLVEGNLFENNWRSHQAGYAVLFTVRNQDGTAPWSTVEDVTFEKNTVRNVSYGVNVLGMDDTPGKVSLQAKRIRVRNNLFDGIGAYPPPEEPTLAVGHFLLVNNHVADLTVDHNTVVNTGNVVTIDGATSENFTFTNNVANHNEFGVIGSGVGIGSKALNWFFAGYTFQRNTLAGELPDLADLYPGDNQFPASLEAVGLVKRNDRKYVLQNNSPLRGAGLDGADVGCNLTEVFGAEGTARDGVPG